jgi:hypothetical protein
MVQGLEVSWCAVRLPTTAFAFREIFRETENGEGWYVRCGGQLEFWVGIKLRRAGIKLGGKDGETGCELVWGGLWFVIGKRENQMWYIYRVKLEQVRLKFAQIFLDVTPSKGDVRENMEAVFVIFGVAKIVEGWLG